MNEEVPMTRSANLWRIGLAIFTVINVLGAPYAAWMGEPVHAAVHVVLLGAAYVVWRRAPWVRREEVSPTQLPDGRLEYLQQSVDAIALEVERIGEAQRFNEKLRAERVENPEGEPKR
jgi:hypothetical protein